MKQVNSMSCSHTAYFFLMELGLFEGLTLHTILDSALKDLTDKINK